MNNCFNFNQKEISAKKVVEERTKQIADYANR